MNDLVEMFRKALMREHHNDWDMETVSEAAHICAQQLEQDGWRYVAPKVFGSEWSPGDTPPPFKNRWPVYRRVEGERE